MPSYRAVSSAPIDRKSGHKHQTDTKCRDDTVSDEPPLDRHGGFRK